MPALAVEQLRQENQELWAQMAEGHHSKSHRTPSQQTTSRLAQSL